MRVLTLLDVVPMYTSPHEQGMRYTPEEDRLGLGSLGDRKELRSWWVGLKIVLML